MQFLCQYPIAAEHVLPHCGRQVCVVLADGEVVCGIIDRVHEGHLVLRPIGGVPDAAILNVKKSVQANPKFKQRKTAEKAQIKGFGGFPFGWNFGNFGWGAGWWWFLPLLALAAIAAFPFFFW